MTLKVREISIFCFAWSANWFSLIASFCLNPSFSKSSVVPFDLNNPNSIYATGGFPFKVYDYPLPPMGPGPEQSEIPFLMNFIFWLLVTILFFLLLKKQADNKKIMAVSITAAVLSTVIGLVYLVLKFD